MATESSKQEVSDSRQFVSSGQGKARENTANFDPEEFRLRRRLPANLPRRHFDIYVTNKTEFKVQFDRCTKLIQEEEPEIYLHSLGAAIPRALNLALKLQKAYESIVTLDTVTSSAELTDDFEPIQRSGGEDQRTDSHQPRHTPAVHIKISRKPPETVEENQPRQEQ